MHNIFEHGPLAEMDIEHRRALSGLASKIAYHIQDNDVHLTEKEKAAVKKLVEDSQTTKQVDIDLSEYAKITAIPKKVSQLENDKGYITEIGDQYMTKSEAESYINKILSGLDIATTAQLNSAIQDLQSQINSKCTIDQVNTLIVEKLGAINNQLNIHDK